MSQTIFEEINVTGKDLLKRIKKLIKEGNIRRLIIKDRKGKVLLEMPLTMGAASLGGMMILTPYLAAISFIALMATEATILVERDKNVDDKEVEAEEVEIVEE